MARKPNIDLRRFERKESERKVATREQRVYFLIVCEGKCTEPNYFNAFKRELPPYTLHIEPIGAGKNTLSLVDHAIDLKSKSPKPYDSVWVVFDKDDFDKNFDNAIAKAEANGIKCAWSNEAFELWYILHFKYVETPISRHKYGKHIETHLSKHTGKKFHYTKNHSTMFELLAQHGNQAQAIKWAKKLEKTHIHKKSFVEYNPSTRVYALVEELNNPQSLLS